MKPTILIDESLAKIGGRDLFKCHGTLIETRSFPPRLLAKANALIIRTNIKISSDILKLAHGLSFIGAASSGFDHLDIPAIQKHSVQFSYAAGSNAHAVVSYVLSALAVTNRLEDLLQGRLLLGIIGFGHIGQHLTCRLNSLANLLSGNIRILVYDPMLKLKEIERLNAMGARAVSLQQILAADCISLHCSLTRNGQGSKDMLDANMLLQLKRHQVLINTARADVLAQSAWQEMAKDACRIKASLIFDVWHKNASHSLVRRCSFATPHIAGYTLAGKRLALYSVYKEFCRHYDITPTPQSARYGASILDSECLPQLQARESITSYIKRLLLMNYDLVRDSLHTKRVARLAPTTPPSEIFATLRDNYTLRQRMRDPESQKRSSFPFVGS